MANAAWDGMNETRLKRAKAAINAWCSPHRPCETDFSDLLCDLMHYADKHALCFKDQVRIAKRNHEREVRRGTR